jgi:hydrogenase nickel incorporation protein HypA/HybF
MHELPVISRIVEICLRHAANNNARKILSIELQVGPLSDLEPEWMQRYFDHVSKETIAAGARLKIDKLPLRYRCTDCEHEFILEIQDCAGPHEIVCSGCESANITCISDNGYRIGNLEIV